MPPQHIAIIGAGVVGVCSAWMLSRAGHRVTLIDRRSAAGQGASFGNAAQLSFAFSDAMPSPKLLRQLPGILLGRDAALRIRIAPDPDFARWGWRFLSNCTGRAWLDNTRTNLALARASAALLPQLIDETGVEFEFRRAGKLHLMPDRASLDAASKTMPLKAEFGFEQVLLTADEAMRLEPSLAGYRGALAGALYTPNDSVGDAALFCRRMSDYLVKHHDVTILFDSTVTEVETHRTGGPRVRALRFADKHALAVDAVVIATGADSLALKAASVLLRDIWPVRGYSFTIDANDHAPSVSLTDTARKLAFARLGKRLRVAGLADICARRSGFDSARYANFVQAAMEAMPDAIPHPPSEISAWSGERPMSSSSVPIIHASKRVRGLFLNTGHGMLGWTLALGSAARLVCLVEQSD